jgi:cell division protein FtsL
LHGHSKTLKLLSILYPLCQSLLPKEKTTAILLSELGSAIRIVVLKNNDRQFVNDLNQLYISSEKRDVNFFVKNGSR